MEESIRQVGARGMGSRWGHYLRLRFTVRRASGHACGRLGSPAWGHTGYERRSRFTADAAFKTQRQLLCQFSGRGCRA